MSEGFQGSVDNSDKKPVAVIDDGEYAKLIKKYKKLKKFQKSTMYEVARLSGKDTEIERLIQEYSDEQREPDKQD